MKTLRFKNFSVDRSLGYLIQQSTKDSTQEILSYFHGVTSFVVQELERTSKAYWLSKDVVLFYKETPISYRIRLRGRGPGSLNPGEEQDMSVDVTYPADTDMYNVSELMTAVTEAGLELSTDEEALPKFDIPRLKAPKCLKAVVAAQNAERESDTTK